MRSTGTTTPTGVANESAVIIHEEKRIEVAPIYTNDLIFIEIHESEVPWLKIFTKVPKKEFSDCSRAEKEAIWDALDIIEKLMLSYYAPEKINIASFGNMLPHVHWHIMARFKEDSYFPEPMWGTVQRKGRLDLPSMEQFCKQVVKELDKA